jgi:hypothetical protein
MKAIVQGVLRCSSLSAGCPVGRAEGTNGGQDYDNHAAEFCAGTKMEFHIGAHSKTLPTDSVRTINSVPHGRCQWRNPLTALPARFLRVSAEKLSISAE